MRHRWYLLTVLLGVLLLTTACGGDDASPTEPDDDDGGAETIVEEPMEILGLRWTSAVDEETGEPVDSVNAFTTISPAVVAVVEVRNVPDGTVFTASWSIDGIDVPEATMSVTADEDLAVAWVSFEFVRDDARYFPLGDLTVTVTTDTGESIDSEIPIQLP